MRPTLRIIEDIDCEPEPLRSDLQRLVELAAADYLELFPPHSDETLAPADQ